jgi:hypothetical protein
MGRVKTVGSSNEAALFENGFEAERSGAPVPAFETRERTLSTRQALYFSPITVNGPAPGCPSPPANAACPMAGNPISHLGEGNSGIGVA